MNDKASLQLPELDSDTAFYQAERSHASTGQAMVRQLETQLEQFKAIELSVSAQISGEAEEAQPSSTQSDPSAAPPELPIEPAKSAP